MSVEFDYQGPNYHIYFNCQVDNRYGPNKKTIDKPRFHSFCTMLLLASQAIRPTLAFIYCK